LVLALVESIDLLVLWWNRANGAGFLFYGIHWVAFPTLAAWGLWLGRARLMGLYTAFTSIVTAWFVQDNFRGAYARFGTFENWRDDPRSWLVPSGLGVASGLIAGCLLGKSKPPSLTFAWGSVMVLFLVALISACATFFVRGVAVDWMPTNRWLAVGVISIVLGLVIVMFGGNKN